MESGMYGRKGSPWEFNLRDVFRWCELMLREQQLPAVEDNHRRSMWEPWLLVDTLYLQRMRTRADRAGLLERFKEVFPEAFSSTGASKVSCFRVVISHSIAATNRLHCRTKACRSVHLLVPIAQLLLSSTARARRFSQCVGDAFSCKSNDDISFCLRTVNSHAMNSTSRWERPREVMSSRVELVATRSSKSHRIGFK